MPNSIDFLKAEAWESVLQEVLFEANIGMQICDKRYDGSFDGNDTVHIPYQDKISSLPLANSYADATKQNLNTGEDTMTLNELEHWSVDLSTVDVKEMKISPKAAFMKSGAQAFLEKYDDSIMAHYADAGDLIQDGDLATATNGGGTNDIDLDLGSEVYEICVRLNQKLNEANVNTGERFIILSPVEEALINLDTTFLVRATGLGDKVVTGGYMGRINGIKVYTSNNLVTETSTKHLLGGAGKPIFFAANIKPKVLISTPQMGDGFYWNFRALTKFDTKVTTASARRLLDIPVTG